MSGDDPKLVAWLLARFGPGGAAAGTLDEDLLVGYAEDRLTTEERTLVEARLAEDPEARRVLRLAPTAQAPRSARRTWTLPIAAAAVLLVAVGVAWMLRDGGDELPTDPHARLLTLADRLAAEEPEVFGTLRSRIEDETVLGVPAVERGGVRILAPRGEMGWANPTLRWDLVSGAKVYRVRISREGGDAVFTTSAQATTLELEDALEPGAYILDVRAETPFGEASGSVVFRIASPEARRGFTSAAETIAATAPAEDRHALRAYYAMAREYFYVARESLRLLETEQPNDGRAKRIRRLLGALAP